MNRSQRRSAARRPTAVPMVRMHDLTMAEAELLAECCDAYLLQLDTDVPPQERCGAQQWAYERAGQLRELLQAAVDGRPSYDEHGQRQEPETTKSPSSA